MIGDGDGWVMDRVRWWEKFWAACLARCLSYL